MKRSGLDVERVRDSIKHGGEFRIHLVTSKSGSGCVARMWHPDGFIVGRASGSGYDRQGTALGQAINLFFSKELQRLPLPVQGKAGGWSGLYGLSRDKDGVQTVDGGRGLEAMISILVALGFRYVCAINAGRYSTILLALTSKAIRGSKR